MAKAKSRYVCNQCGSEFAQMFGKCPECGTWGSLVEEAIASEIHSPNGKPPKSKSALTLAQIGDDHQTKLPSGYGELDRVLGGGIVPGALVLIGGEPGIGKTRSARAFARSPSARGGRPCP